MIPAYTFGFLGGNSYECIRNLYFFDYAPSNLRQVCALLFLLGLFTPCLIEG